MCDVDNRDCCGESICKSHVYFRGKQLNHSVRLPPTIYHSAHQMDFLFQTPPTLGRCDFWKKLFDLNDGDYYVDLFDAGQHLFSNAPMSS